MREVFCDKNSLTTLNVTSLANLQYLRCDDNFLSSIDLSRNPQLVSLDCSRNRMQKLSTIDNTNLRFLDCSNNALKELELQRNVNLAFFNGSSNQLEQLFINNGNNTAIIDFNVMGNPNLLCVQVDNPNFSKANWRNIDASAKFSFNCSGNRSFLAPENSPLVSIYPNPVRVGETINIDIPQGLSSDYLEVINGFGQVINKQLLDKEKDQVKLLNNSWTAGVYYLRFSGTNYHHAILIH